VVTPRSVATTAAANVQQKRYHSLSTLPKSSQEAAAKLASEERQAGVNVGSLAQSQSVTPRTRSIVKRQAQNEQARAPKLTIQESESESITDSESGLTESERRILRAKQMEIFRNNHFHVKFDCSYHTVHLCALAKNKSPGMEKMRAKHGAAGIVANSKRRAPPSRIKMSTNERLAMNSRQRLYRARLRAADNEKSDGTEGESDGAEGENRNHY
jgi:hypothetical protein